MKNFIIGILVAAAVGVGIYYGVVRKSFEGSGEFAPGGAAGMTAPAPGEAPSGKGTSVLSALNDTVFMAAAIKPKNLQPVIDHIEIVKGKLQATVAWKKLKLDEALEGVSLEKLLQQASQAGLPGAPGEMPALQVSPFEVFKVIQSVWMGLTEFTLALSSKDFALEPSSNLKAPGIHLSATFNDDVVVKQVSEFLKQMTAQPAAALDAPDASQAAAGMPFPLKAVGSDGKKYEFSAPPPINVQGAINIQEKRLTATIGTVDETSFLAGSGSPLLVESPQWKKAAAALLPKPLIYAYLDNTRLKPYLANIIRLATQMGGPGETPGVPAPADLTESIMGAWSNFLLVSMGLNFQQGMGARQCVDVSAGSSADKIYREYLSMARSESAAGKSAFQNLIGPKTIAAIHVPRRYVLLAVDQIRQSVTQSAPAGSAATPEWEAFHQQLDRIKSSIQKMKVDEFGVIVNGPAFGPMPEFGIFVGAHEKINLSEFAAALTDLITSIGQEVGAGNLPTVSVGQNADPALGIAGDRIELNMGSGQAIPLVPVSENTLVATESPEMISAVPELLKSPNGFFGKLSISDADLVARASEADFYLYLNTDGVIELAKPFLPLLLMQRQDLQIGMPEIEEVLNILKFGILAVQSSSEASEGEICSELRVATF